MCVCVCVCVCEELSMNNPYIYFGQELQYSTTQPHRTQNGEHT